MFTQISFPFGPGTSPETTFVPQLQKQDDAAFQNSISHLSRTEQNIAATNREMQRVLSLTPDQLAKDKSSMADTIRKQNEKVIEEQAAAAEYNRF